MLVRWKAAALLALVPALAIAAPKAKPKKPPAKKPPTTEPAPAATPSSDTGDAASKDKAPEPAPPSATTPAPPPSGGGASGGTGGGGTGGGAGDDVKPTDAADKPADGQDVDALRQEYLSLRDELFKSRARANAVASQLYSTRVTIKFAWGSARHYGVAKASVRLDGATVFEDSTGVIGNDDGVRFTGFVAPGRHLITFHVEATGKDDDSFTSTTEAQIVVKAIANKDLIVTGHGHD